MLTAVERLFVPAVTLALALAPGPTRAQQSPPPAECPGASPTFRVGHTIRTLDVPGVLDPSTGTSGEPRTVQVHLWYPARSQDDCGESGGVTPGPGGCHAPLAVYGSRLNGLFSDPLSLLGWVPLSWTIAAARAYEDARPAEGDGPFPVVVFSHGNQNEAIDHAYALEALASRGYVVAAPDHLANTQEEVRIDFANDALQDAGQQQRIPCLDRAAPDPVTVKGVARLHCSRQSVPKSMIDRYHDVEAVLDALPGWLGHLVDLDRVGVMGHSRGTITALSLAGGSNGDASWGRQLGLPGLEFAADPRVKAVMGLAIGVKGILLGANVRDITVPTLLVAGSLDVNPGPAISQLALGTIPATTEKQLVTIPDAVHRHFDSGYCAQLQAAGAIAVDPQHPGAALDRQTAAQILLSGRTSSGASLSGDAIDYCGYDAFDSPTDITALADGVYASAPPPVGGFVVTPSDVPTHGLRADAVMGEVVELAATFFGTALAPGDRRPFDDCLPAGVTRLPGASEPTGIAADAADATADDPD